MCWIKCGRELGKNTCGCNMFRIKCSKSWGDCFALQNVWSEMRRLLRNNSILIQTIRIKCGKYWGLLFWFQRCLIKRGNFIRKTSIASKPWIAKCSTSREMCCVGFKIFCIKCKCVSGKIMFWSKLFRIECSISWANHRFRFKRFLINAATY